jgi:phage shock protein A
MVLYEAVLYEVSKKKLLAGLGAGLALAGAAYGLHKKGEEELEKHVKSMYKSVAQGAPGFAKEGLKHEAEVEAEALKKVTSPLEKMKLGLKGLFGSTEKDIANLIKRKKLEHEAEEAIKAGHIGTGPLYTATKAGEEAYEKGREMARKAREFFGRLF